jgi:hypothetical protein
MGTDRAAATRSKTPRAASGRRPLYFERNTLGASVLNQWQDQGVWEKIRLTFLGTLDHQAKLDWDAAFLYGSFVPGKKGARISPMAGKAKGAPSIC